MKHVDHKGNGFKSGRGNHQIPSTNNQTMTEVLMTQFLRKLAGALVIRRLDNWNLFGVWDLVIGI
jgi:hypothetical protein